jgi:DNA-binding transcriptional MerR regulator
MSINALWGILRITPHQLTAWDTTFLLKIPEIN